MGKAPRRDLFGGLFVGKINEASVVKEFLLLSPDVVQSERHPKIVGATQGKVVFECI